MAGRSPDNGTTTSRSFIADPSSIGSSGPSIFAAKLHPFNIGLWMSRPTSGHPAITPDRTKADEQATGIPGCASAEKRPGQHARQPAIHVRPDTSETGFPAGIHGPSSIFQPPRAEAHPAFIQSGRSAVISSIALRAFKLHVIFRSMLKEVRAPSPQICLACMNWG
jgi:hypothetical protein